MKKMNFDTVKNIAREKGIKLSFKKDDGSLGRKNKLTLVREIQIIEGNNSCYNHPDYAGCKNMGCCWTDCRCLSK